MVHKIVAFSYRPCVFIRVPLKRISSLVKTVVVVACNGFENHFFAYEKHTKISENVFFNFPIHLWAKSLHRKSVCYFFDSNISSFFNHVRMCVHIYISYVYVKSLVLCIVALKSVVREVLQRKPFGLNIGPSEQTVLTVYADDIIIVVFSPQNNNRKFNWRSKKDPSHNQSMKTKRNL